jgi:hypothetical protein
MTTIAPPRPDVAELDQLATDDPHEVCHLFADGVSLCGVKALFVAGVDLDEAKEFGDPSASPCIGSCGRNRCAACAAEYTMREARHV